MMRSCRFILVAAVTILCNPLHAEDISWNTKQLASDFYSEGVTAGDFNHDGIQDVASGPWWYEGPSFEQRHQFYAQDAFDPHGYSNNFFSFTDDFNSDGWDDILVYGFPGNDVSWYENPKGADRFWPRHQVMDVIDNESPTFLDINRDGRKDVICSVGGYFGFAEVNQDDPALPWKFNAISDQSAGGKFTHGLGVGDVNGDGRLDILEKNGWWEQPEELGNQWVQHKTPFGEGYGPAQIYTTDVDGDGDNDVICSLSAHGYGLAWYENLGDGDQFTIHKIMGATPAENEFGLVFSQLHAVEMADINGDGLQDIITGKRYWAHGPSGDADPQHPAVVYWFELQRSEDGSTVRWLPRQIDNNSGVGTEVKVADLNGDGHLDVFVGNKKGTYVHWQVAHEHDDEHTQGDAHKHPGDHDRNAMIGEQEKAKSKKSGNPEAAGLQPEEAAAAMTVPKGFQVKLAAGEPMVHQPIAMTFDHRGRMWLAEAYEYPIRAPEGQGRDTIVILEDTDQDGDFDTRTVFADNLNLVSGLEVGFGGVWVAAAPYFMFIPDADGDDRPDSEPQILLDGFSLNDTHETQNAFIWGPDGWLYGCHGVFNPSRVGKPGCADSDRIPLTAAVWRYHPTRHVFEAFARGTSNPWGVDFNDYGHAFITACVIPHMYHMIQGGRYQRQGGNHVNPYTYDDIKTIADHLHYAGNIRDHAWWGRNENVGHSSTDAAGGGHAHCGALIYLGDNWPRQYRGSIFMTNLLGNRLNNEHLLRVGSGYVASHGHDFLFANDQWFRCVSQRLAPDGSVYLIDWYDKQACHRNDKELWDRTNGRVYQVAYGEPDTKAVDLSKMTDRQLAELQLAENEWHVRMSRRLLQERAATGTINPIEVRDVLIPILFGNGSVPRRLRAAWTLHACGILNNEDLGSMLQATGHNSQYIRAWGIQLDMEDGIPHHLEQFNVMAHRESSSHVRLYLASAMQRMPLKDRWEVANGLVRHGDDSSDHNLPLMIWYGVEPLVPLDTTRALQLGSDSRIPTVTNFIYRRAAESPESITPLLASLKSVDDLKVQKQIIGEASKALGRQAKLEMPKVWPEVYAKLAQSDDDELRDQVIAISVKFGDSSIFPLLRELAIDRSNKPASRISALTTLISGKDSGLLPVLLNLLGDPEMRSSAIAGLAGYNDPKVVPAMVAVYNELTDDQKSSAMSTLSSRAPFASQMLDAIESGIIPRDDLNAYTVRQLLLFEDDELNSKIERVWGQIRTMSEGKEKQILAYKQQLTPEILTAANLPNGRAIYAKTCQKCHMLFGTGGKIGPDITGSNRAELDYILHNIVDPNALIGKAYQTTQLVLADGRVIAGLAKDETETALTIQTADDLLVIDLNDIEQRRLANTSMMPEGQLDNLSKEEVRDLIAYLASPIQIPLPGEGPYYNEKSRSVVGALEFESMTIAGKTAGNAAPQSMKSFVNGQWSKDNQLWWTGAKVGDRLTLTFDSGLEGDYELFASFTKAIDYGVCQIKLNGQPIGGSIDFYNDGVVSTGPVGLGIHHLKSGTNALQIEIIGANDKAQKSYMVGLDYLYLQEVKPTDK